MNSNRRATWNRLCGLYGAAAALVCVASLGGSLGHWWWPLELMSHFRVQYAIVLLPAVLVTLARKQFKTAAVLGSLAIANLAVVVPLYFGRATSSSGDAELRAVLLNVFTENRDMPKVLDFLGEADADVIVLMEVNARWTQALAPLRERYPHACGLPREDNFGIAVYSRIPWKSSEVAWIGEAEVPSIVAEFDIDGRELKMIATHPLPPMDALYAEERNRQLAALGRLAREHTEPLMIVGDLNTTSWSSYFRDLIATSGLRDSRAGFGIQPTWPAHLWPLWIPLDHCLVSPSIAIRNRRVGPNVGSDHFPVIVDFAL